jgi:prophage DNA circulation protein
MALKQYPWRQRLRPASFRGARFHVDVDSIAGGRRVAQHEYPKRNQPYSEDMGRRMRRHTITGYVIMSPQNPDYTQDRDALKTALEQDGPGTLVHPSLGTEKVMVDQYSVTENREKGGMATFEMVFLEAGAPGDIQSGSVDNSTMVSQGASSLESSSSSSLDNSMAGGPAFSFLPGVQQ